MQSFLKSASEEEQHIHNGTCPVPTVFTSNSRAYSYVVAIDLVAPCGTTGMAPCVKDGLLSLALCKPNIRKSAKVGDVIIGYLPVKAFAMRGLVKYMAVITALLPPLEYHGRVDMCRPDQIYNATGGKLVHKGHVAYHLLGNDSLHQQEKDGRGNVLLSTQFVCVPGTLPLVINDMEFCALRGGDQGHKGPTRMSRALHTLVKGALKNPDKYKAYGAGWPL